MQLKDLPLAPWFYPANSLTKHFFIRVILGEEKLKFKGRPSFEVKGAPDMPTNMKSFIRRHGATIFLAMLNGKDTPIFGNGSDWDESAHRDFLEDILDGMSTENLYEKHIHGDDDIDYFRYSYGADGDAYDIEDEYKDPTLSGEFTELESNLYINIKYGLVSMDWYKAAKKLGITKWDKKQLRKIDKAYSAVADWYDNPNR
jgi:hypothetical protein